MSKEEFQVCPLCGGAVSAETLMILRDRGVIVSHGKAAVLPYREFRVFEILFDARPRVLTKEQIMSRVYSVLDEEPEIKIVDVFVCKIRKKIEPLGIEIQTHWGQGYSIAFTGNIVELGKAA